MVKLIIINKYVILLIEINKIVQAGVLQNFTSSCNTDLDCLKKTSFSKCSKNQCGCQFGYHMDGFMCSKLN